MFHNHFGVVFFFVEFAAHIFNCVFFLHAYGIYFCGALWLYDVQMNVMNANRVENDVAHLGKIDEFLCGMNEKKKNVNTNCIW